MTIVSFAALGSSICGFLALGSSICGFLALGSSICGFSDSGNSISDLALGPGIASSSGFLDSGSSKPEAEGKAA